MKNFKKHNSIILLPLLVLSFITIGLFSTSKATAAVSDSITVNVMDDTTGSTSDPVCSKTTYNKCEVGTVTLEKEESDKYLWTCTNNNKSLGCAKVKPVCLTTVNGCDKGYSSNYEETTDTYRWLCNGSNGNPTVSCEINKNRVDGKCSVPTSNPTTSPTDTAHEGLNGTPINRLHDNDTYMYTWTCQGTNGGGDVYCEEKHYVSGICSDKIGECSLGTLYDSYKNEDGEIAWWRCMGPNGNAPKGSIYESKVSDYCYPPSGDGEDDQVDKNGQCGEKAGECFVGTASESTKNLETNLLEWTCYGLGNGESAFCQEELDEKPLVPDPVNGQCGSSSGSFFNKIPTENLCQQGKASGVYSEGENFWSWTCSGLYGGENDVCKTASISLSPKISGCYIKEGESSCQITSPFSWIVSGAYSLLSLVTNKEELNLGNAQGEKNLEISYPFSPIKLRIDGNDLVYSRGWAICEQGLFWNKDLNVCEKPVTYPEEPEPDEPEDPDAPRWVYESPSSCVIQRGETIGEMSLIGTCKNYDPSNDLYCLNEDGSTYMNRTKEISYSCFKNPAQPFSSFVELEVSRENGVPITEDNPLTSQTFNISWNAWTNPAGRFSYCDDIKVNYPLVSLGVETNGALSGEAEHGHIGIPGDLTFSITCYDKLGLSHSDDVKVYFGKISGTVTEY